MSSSVNGEPKGVIGKYVENGLPVILKFVQEFPEPEIREQFPQLTVISWIYDGSENNGMPEAEVNEQIMALEDAIDDLLTIEKIAQHAYSRTGNGLKELVYYISDQEVFMARFNQSLQGQPRYPIEINFYNDPEWEDFEKLLKDFEGK